MYNIGNWNKLSAQKGPQLLKSDIKISMQKATSTRNTVKVHQILTTDSGHKLDGSGHEPDPAESLSQSKSTCKQEV